MIVVVIALALAALAAYAGASSPWRITYARLQFSGNALVARNVNVTNGGVPLLRASRIAIGYSLRDLLPGSRHRYGLRSIEVDGATITLTRQADGSYSLPLHGGGPAPPPSPTQLPNRVPIAFTFRVRDSAIALRSPAAFDPQARAIDIRGITADGVVDTAAVTKYAVGGAFAQSHPLPFTVKGRIDVARGYAMHHIAAAGIPLRPITDFFVNTRAFGINAGAARNVDLRVYELGSSGYHLSGHASIEDANIHVVGLSAPVEHLTGEVQYLDDDVFFTHLRGEAGGLPLDATGSVYDFADPKFTIGLSSRGNLSSLRRLFAFARNQDIAGPVDIGVSIGGPIASPVILFRVDGSAEYRGIAFDELHARGAYYDSTVSFLPIAVRAQGATVTIRGGMEIGDTVRTRAAVRFEAPADTLPYAGELLGREPLTGDVLLDGNGTNFYGYGSLTARTGPARVAAVIHASPDGILDVAPLEIATEHGTLAGGYHLDRKTNHSAFWIDAHDLVLHTPAQTSFLGITVPSIPPIDGTVDRALLSGGGPSGNGALIAGVVDAHDLTIAHVPFDRLHAQIGGTLANAAIDPAIASGPWGSLDGRGSFSPGSIAVRGAFRGTLQGLRPFLGNVDARGTVAGTASVSVVGGRIVVQAEHMRLQGAQVRGIPVTSGSGTIALDKGDVIVKNARADFAGGSLVAAGSYARGISLVATGLNAAHLKGLGLPLAGGRIDAEASFGVAIRYPATAGLTHQFYHPGVDH